MTSLQSCLKKTTCPYCGVGCGIDVKVENNQAVSLMGTPDHPANFGRLCVKGSNLIATNGLEGRLLTPMVNKQPTNWQEATDVVAEKFAATIEKYGADSVAFYVSGQLLTEDYYVANKLMKGYIGSANIDTNSRLCMSSAVAGYKRAFGEDIVPCDYHDLEHTELLVLIGSNAAWTHPVLFQRIERAKKLNPAMNVVVIDPRRTASAELCDLHLAIKPGTDAVLYNGLLNYLDQNDGIDNDFVSAHTSGFDDCLAQVTDFTVAKVAELCEVSEQLLTRFFKLFAHSQTSVSFYSQGINQSSSGTDKNNAIINCHLATGKIGKLGCGPFSITGQPNAMGGREVGGLANTLAAHMDLENAEHRNTVKQFWQSPKIADKAGFKAVELFNQIKAGKVKAVWIMATNPMVSLPDRNLIEQALSACEFVVVSDCVASNDTIAFADVVLPATTWSEKNGTVTNSERRISRQRGLVTPPNDCKHDWQIISEIAKKMGFSDGFNYQHPQQIFCEYAQLTAENNHGTRALNLAGLANITEAEYEALAPVQWPIDEHSKSKFRLFEDGKFFTKSGKANFVAIIPQAPILSITAEFPFSLSSGRIRDQWHTMTRTGKTSILTEHTKQPEISLNPNDALDLSLQEGDLVCVQNNTGKIYVVVTIDQQMKEKQCFVPIHWSKEFASNANVSQLFASIIDPVSGQPELKFAPVKISKVAINEYGLVVSPIKLNFMTQDLPVTSHWVCYQTSGLTDSAWVYLFQHEEVVPDFANQLKTSITQAEQVITKQQMIDEWVSCQRGQQTHFMGLKQQQFQAFIFINKDKININEQWLSQLLDHQIASLADINAVLLGQAPEDKGRKVCSCFSVYEKEIIDEIVNNKTFTVDALGDALKCGTNCGSCKTELSAILSSQSINKTIEIKKIATVAA